jgi:lysyl-tRNA synthetase class 2
VDYYEALKKEAGVDLHDASIDDLRKKAESLGIVPEPFAREGRLIDLIFKKTVRPKLVSPCFLVNPPVSIEPLAKRTAEDPKRVYRFQIMAAGTELGKGFSELNDPRDQRNRFEEQMRLREGGDKEAQMIDEEFIEALEYGMPPAAGFGVSERLFAVLMDRSIRETVAFPLLRAEK